MTGKLTNAQSSTVCYYVVKVKKGDKFDTVFSCLPSDLGVGENSETQSNNSDRRDVDKCSSAPLCSSITYNHKYKGHKEYLVEVTPAGNSDQVDISIPPSKISFDAATDFKHLQ